MNLTTDKLAYRIDDAAAASGLSRRTLYSEIRDGRLQAVKVAGRRLILKADLEVFLNSTRGA